MDYCILRGSDVGIRKRVELRIRQIWNTYSIPFSHIIVTCIDDDITESVSGFALPFTMALS